MKQLARAAVRTLVLVRFVVHVRTLAAPIVAACVTDSTPYPVFAVAELRPLDREAGPDIHGQLEVIGREDRGVRRALAAYHVHLPDNLPRCVRIVRVTSCDTPVEDPRVQYTECTEIRRVGDETHFFIGDLVIDRQRVAVDTGIASASFFVYSGDPAFAFIEDLPAQDGTHGLRLACGAFIETAQQ